MLVSKCVAVAAWRNCDTDPYAGAPRSKRAHRRGNVPKFPLTYLDRISEAYYSRHARVIAPRGYPPAADVIRLNAAHQSTQRTNPRVRGSRSSG